MRVQNLKRNRDVERKKGTINWCLFHKNPKGTSKPSPPLCSHLETTAAFKGLSTAIGLLEAKTFHLRPVTVKRGTVHTSVSRGILISFINNNLSPTNRHRN